MDNNNNQGEKNKSGSELGLKINNYERKREIINNQTITTVIETPNNSSKKNDKMDQGDITPYPQKVSSNETEATSKFIISEELKKNYKKLNDDLIFQKKEYKKLSNNFVEKEKEIKDINEKYKKIEGELKAKNLKLSEFEKINNEKEKKINEILRVNIDLNEKLKAKETDINNLNNQLAIEKSNLLKIDQENKKLKAELEELQKKNDELTPITTGLDNIGATCYMNATLQSFSNVPQLTNYFLNKYKSDNKKIMSNEYYTVIQNLWKKENKENNRKSYAPESFKKVLSKMNPMFAGIAANDSKDLINFLIETFHSELNEADEKNLNNNMISSADQLDENKMLSLFLTDMKARYNSPISSLFYGVLETKSQCTNCKRIKYNFQIYSFLEFPLEQVNMYCFNNNRRLNFNGQGNPDIDLYECFDHYQAILTMNGDNQIYCNECGKLFDAFYATYLYSMPNYLIINLNRGKNAVYQCNVKFPEYLNLYNYVHLNQKNSMFQLQSVICHIGPSSMGGHFIAYCRHYKDNNWYKYNDSIVTKCTSQNEYLNGMPYILFYKALDDK